MLTNKHVDESRGDTLFYDAQCPICSAEVQRLQTQLHTDLYCVDIHQAELSLIEKERLFSQLHLRRADGTWLVGLEANVAAWQHTRWRPFANILLWPGVRWFAELGYWLWLRWYQKQRAST